MGSRQRANSGNDPTDQNRMRWEQLERRSWPTGSTSTKALPKTEYLELNRRQVPEAAKISTEFERLLREFAPAVQRAPKNSQKTGEKKKKNKTALATTRLQELCEMWSKIVGAEFSEVCRPSRFRGGVLTIEVDSAPLSSELESFHRERLLEGFRREGLEELCDLRFMISSS